MRPEDHMGLVHHVVRKMRLGTSLELADAIGIGMLALVIASKKYDPERGEFSTYAIHKIRYAVLDEQRKLAGRKYKKPTILSYHAELKWHRGSMGMVNPAMDKEDNSIDWRTWGETEDVRRTWPLLTERERRIVLMKALGYKHCEIAVKEGISGARVPQLLREMRERIAA